MSHQAPIRVGVLGATGYIGQPYRREMRAVSDVRMVALCARRRDLLDAAATEDGAELATTDWRAVVDHPDVNLVVVATPDALHHEAVMACAQAGKHVICEKPVGKNAAQAAEMWQAYSATPELFHFVPFWTRYADIFVRAKAIVSSGALGNIRGVIYRWHNPRPAGMPLTWRDKAELSAGGSIADVGSHAYDTVAWILGEQATRVLSHAATVTEDKADVGDINLQEALSWGSQTPTQSKQQRGTTPDYASIAWEFTGGAVGTLIVSHASFLRKGLCPELELHGTEASLAINRVTGDITWGLPDRPPEVREQIFDQGLGNRFEKFVFPALRSRLAGEAPGEYPTLEQGWQVQRFTDAALASAQSGTWATVSET